MYTASSDTAVLVCPPQLPQSTVNDTTTLKTKISPLSFLPLSPQHLADVQISSFFPQSVLPHVESLFGRSYHICVAHGDKQGF